MLRRKRFGSVKVWIPVGGALAFIVVAGVHWFLSKNSKPSAITQIEEKKVHVVEKRTPASEKKAEGDHGYPVYKATKPGDACPQIEWGGRGPASAPSTEEWKSFMASYHATKASLQKWAASQSSYLSAEAIAVLNERIASIRVERPPTPTEPDLGWRGQVVLSRDIDGKPLLRVGGGFLAFFRAAPERARFELARAMLHNWSPCSLKGTAAAGSWDGYVKCQGASSQTCEAGGFDESSWAVSTAIAAEVASPQCTIPALLEKACSVVSKGVALR